MAHQEADEAFARNPQGHASGTEVVTNVDSTSPAGLALLGQHFISQSAPDIRCKLQKLQMGPQTNQILYMAFMVYNTQDLEERKRE